MCLRTQVFEAYMHTEKFQKYSISSHQTKKLYEHHLLLVLLMLFLYATLQCPLILQTRFKELTPEAKNLIQLSESSTYFLRYK